MITVQPQVLNVARLVIFPVWLALAWLAFFIYAINTLIKQRTYFLRVRFPSLVLADLLQGLFTFHAVCLHEIMLAQGRRLPCVVTNLSTALTPVNYLAIFLVRSLQLLVMFDPSFRERFYEHIPGIKSSIAHLCVVVGVTFTAAMHYSPTPFCHNPDLCTPIHPRGCVWGASYYLVLALVAAFHVVLGPILWYMTRLDIQEKIGYTLEFRRILTMSVALNSIIFLSIILVDWGVLGVDAHFITDLALCTAFSANFWIGHVIPAETFGYGPNCLRGARRCWRRLCRPHHKIAPLAAPAAGLLVVQAPVEAPEQATVSSVTSDGHASAVVVVDQPPPASARSYWPSVLVDIVGEGSSEEESVDRRKGAATLVVEQLTLDEILDTEELRDALLCHCRNHLDEESMLYLVNARDVLRYQLPQNSLASEDGAPATAKDRSLATPRATPRAQAAPPTDASHANLSPALLMSPRQDSATPPPPGMPALLPLPSARSLATDRQYLTQLCRTYLRPDGLYPLSLDAKTQAAIRDILRWSGSNRKAPLLDASVPTEAVIRLLQHVGQMVREAIEDELLPIFYESDPTYLRHRAKVLAAAAGDDEEEGGIAELSARSRRGDALQMIRDRRMHRQASVSSAFIDFH